MDLNQAIRLDPQFVIAYYNRGQIYDDLDRPQFAIEEYDEAIRLNPLYAEAYASRARAYTILGKDVEAEQDVERAVELGIDPGSLR